MLSQLKKKRGQATANARETSWQKNTATPQREIWQNSALAQARPQMPCINTSYVKVNATAHRLYKQVQIHMYAIKIWSDSYM